MTTSADPMTVILESRETFLSFLERRVGNRAVAEDILQEAFARGVSHVEALRDGDSVMGWFYRVLKNAVVDYHRRNASANRAISSYANELETVVEPETHAAVCQCVKRLAATLKPEYAEVLQRVEVDGVAVKEFATEARLSASNAGVRVHRARAALREQVLQTCGACATHGCVDCSCRHP